MPASATLLPLSFYSRETLLVARDLLGLHLVRTSPAEIEGRTGYHFFDRVPENIAQALRQKIDNAPIAPPQGGSGDF